VTEAYMPGLTLVILIQVVHSVSSVLRSFL